MKCKRTLVLAASILALTLSAFPHEAAADTGTASQASSDMMRKGGDAKIPYMTVILAAGTLFSALVP